MSCGLVAISQLQEPLCLHQLWEDGSWHVLGLWDLLEWAALFRGGRADGDATHPPVPPLLSCVAAEQRELQPRQLPGGQLL